MKYDIFLSYRRDGGFSTAKHLFDLLSKDGYRVSFDIDTLRSGDFDTTLLNRIDQCKDFIIILDAHAFDRTLSQSISPKQDWLRIELAYALTVHKAQGSQFDTVILVISEPCRIISRENCKCLISVFSQ